MGASPIGIGGVHFGFLDVLRIRCSSVESGQLRRRSVSGQRHARQRDTGLPWVGWQQKRRKGIPGLIIAGLQREDDAAFWLVDILGQPRSGCLREGAEREGLVLELRERGDANLAIPPVSWL